MSFSRAFPIHGNYHNVTIPRRQKRHNNNAGYNQNRLEEKDEVTEGAVIKNHVLLNFYADN